MRRSEVPLPGPPERSAPRGFTLSERPSVPHAGCLHLIRGGGGQAAKRNVA